jgi:hypothetical protein
MSFEEKIKKWVSLDNQICALAGQTKQIKTEKNEVEEDILEYVETKQLKNATINISDGKLRFVTTKQTAPLTLKYVEGCLGKCINNTAHVEQIMKVIRESREVKTIEDIKRYHK